MNGPRILIVVALAIAALAWFALVGQPDADLQRGLDETDQALAAVEEELAALDPLYREVTSRGLMLNLKMAHDNVRSQMAALRSERLELEGDRDLPRRERLPAFRDLVRRADELLATTRMLRVRVQARYDFIRTSTPLLQEARGMRDRLAAASIDDPARAARRSDLAGRFSELEELARTTDRTLQQNVSQGQDLGAATLRGLQDLIGAQQSLLRELQLLEGG